MKILLTGATGFIGKRILPLLLEDGHEVVAVSRDASRVNQDYENNPALSVIEIDFLKIDDSISLPKDIDASYYLIHSMSSSISDFDEMEAKAAEHFVTLVNKTDCKQIIYLGGISNSKALSKHLSSRLRVEEILGTANAALTALRAGIIVGSGSASFEIIRDLVEKLPVMVAPKWLNTRCQPIAIRNVLEFLTGVLGNTDTYNKSFDIGGPEILTYKDMLQGYAEVRGLKRYILTVPVMTPRLSSYWLYFVTSTSYKLAVNLVNSMKVDVVCSDSRILDHVDINLLTYKEAVALALERIAEKKIASSWKDAFVSGGIDYTIASRYEVPTTGVLVDKRIRRIENDPDQVLENIWSIGGKRGWYYGNWLWEVRGILDKLVGGVGLRRGRTHPDKVYPGDALDFWRVIDADRDKRRLLLFAEMKLPGEAWLEFDIIEKEGEPFLSQTATFKPHGFWGRLYWYLISPFHAFVFGGMIRNVERYCSG